MPSRSVKARRAPSRHCRDARVYGHTTTAMHEIEYISPIEYTLPPSLPSTPSPSGFHFQQLVHKDIMTSSVAATITSDYRMSGATELLVIGASGEVRGYTPTAPALNPAGGGGGEAPTKRRRQVAHAVDGDACLWHPRHGSMLHLIFLSMLTWEAKTASSTPTSSHNKPQLFL